MKTSQPTPDAAKCIVCRIRKRKDENLCGWCLAKRAGRQGQAGFTDAGRKRGAEIRNARNSSGTAVAHLGLPPAKGGACWNKPCKGKLAFKGAAYCLPCGAAYAKGLRNG